MRALSKTYVFAMATAMLVWVIAHPPLTLAGRVLLPVTALSLAAMAARATGVRLRHGWPWWAWLGGLVVVDAVAFTAETGAIWDTVGGGWGVLAAAGSGIIMLPLYWALIQQGRGRP